MSNRPKEFESGPEEVEPGHSQEASETRHQVETEIYITPEGQVLITDLTPDLLALAESLAPNDPLLKRLREILSPPDHAEP